MKATVQLTTSTHTLRTAQHSMLLRTLRPSVRLLSRCSPCVGTTVRRPVPSTCCMHWHPVAETLCTPCRMPGGAHPHRHMRNRERQLPAVNWSRCVCHAPAGRQHEQQHLEQTASVAGMCNHTRQEAQPMYVACILCPPLCVGSDGAARAGPYTCSTPSNLVPHASTPHDTPVAGRV